MANLISTRTILRQRVKVDGGAWANREGNLITIDYDYAGRLTRKSERFYADEIRALAKFVEDTEA